MAAEFPLTYTIPRPCEIAVGRGIESTRGPNGRLLQARGTMKEWRRIQTAAEILDLTASAFIRRTLCDMAEQVIQDAKDRGIDVEQIAALFED